MPPPPAPGGLLGVTLGVAPEVGAGDDTVLDDVVWAEELAPALVVPPAGPLVVPLPAARLLSEPLDEPVDVFSRWVPDPVLVDVDGDPDGEHPVTATARIAKTPKPRRASFTLSTVPAMVTRTAM